MAGTRIKNGGLQIQPINGIREREFIRHTCINENST